MPLPSTRMLPDNWQEAHRPVIAATFRSMVQITRLADRRGTRDPIAGRTSFAVPWVLYDGGARVQSRGGGATARGPGGAAVGVNDRIITVGSYLVAIPTDAAEIKVDDLIQVFACPDSPVLSGLMLKVVEVLYADAAWQRSLGCDLQEPSARG